MAVPYKEILATFSLEEQQEIKERAAQARAKELSKKGLRRVLYYITDHLAMLINYPPKIESSFRIIKR